MKLSNKGVFLLLMSAAAGVLAWAWLNSRTLHATSTSHPEAGRTNSLIEFVGGTDQQLGSLKKNEVRKHRLYLKNVSATEDVRIERVKPSCGCLGGTTASKTLLKPGEKAFVEVELIGKTATKRIDGSNYVNFWFDKSPPAHVAFTWDVVQDVALYPEQVSLGEVKEAIEGAITLRPLGRAELAIKSWRSENGHLEVATIDEISGGLRCNYLSKVLPPGEWKDTLVLETNAEIDSEIKVPFSWKVASHVEVFPRTLFIGSVAQGQGIEKVVKVRSVSKTGFQVKEIRSSSDAIRVSALETSSSERERLFRVAFQPPGDKTESVVREEVVFLTDRGDVSMSILGNTFR